MAGLSLETQIVSEMTTDLVASLSLLFFKNSRNEGLPISSSNSQQNFMLIGNLFSKAYLAAYRTARVGPLSSVVPRPRYFSPSIFMMNGCDFHSEGSAGCTSKWLYTT